MGVGWRVHGCAVGQQEGRAVEHNAPNLKGSREAFARERERTGYGFRSLRSYKIRASKSLPIHIFRLILM